MRKASRSTVRRPCDDRHPRTDRHRLPWSDFRATAEAAIPDLQKKLVEAEAEASAPKASTARRAIEVHELRRVECVVTFRLGREGNVH